MFSLGKNQSEIMKGLINSENQWIEISVWLRIDGMGYSRKHTGRIRGGSQRKECMKLRYWRCAETNGDRCLDPWPLTCHLLLTFIILATKEVSQTFGFTVYFILLLLWWPRQTCSGTSALNKCLQRKRLWGICGSSPLTFPRGRNLDASQIVMQLPFSYSTMQFPTSHTSAR